jgi:hypothetical protein
LNLYPPTNVGTAYKRRDVIALTLCILVLVGWLSVILVGDYINQQHRFEIRQKISSFVSEGNKLKEDCITEKERLDLKPVYENWIKRVTEYLSHIDPSYVPRFNMITVGRGGGIGPKINEPTFPR